MKFSNLFEHLLAFRAYFYLTPVVSNYSFAQVDGLDDTLSTQAP